MGYLVYNLFKTLVQAIEGYCFTRSTFPEVSASGSFPSAAETTVEKAWKKNRLLSITRASDYSGSISSSCQCWKTNSPTCGFTGGGVQKVNPQQHHSTQGLTSSQSKRLMSLPHSRWSLCAMQMSGAELETLPSSVFRFSFWEKSRFAPSFFFFFFFAT